MSDIKNAILIVCVLLISCSSNPTVNMENNVILYCSYPADNFSPMISFARIKVNAPDQVTLVDSIMTVELGISAGMLSIELNVDPGLGRRFKVSLLDSDSRELFCSTAIADISENNHHSISLSLSQSGYGSALSVIIFRDLLPWDSRALDSALSEMGLDRGTGENQFYIYPSSEMANIEMRPGIDLVVISNDQPQYFYDNYAANHDRIEQFARDGGTLLWCACDMGWNYGSIDAAGLILPGSVTISYSLDQINLVSTPGYSMLDGFADTLFGNYASQIIFTNLPAGSIEYLKDSSDNPTLIGFAVEEGWVLVSGQPLEYNYDRKDVYNIGDLLPQVIRFLLGIGPGESLSLLPGIGTFVEKDG
ncbi:MAG: hypothetical protein V3W18_07220 [candidate division Zixibacteria bacterium]